MEVDCLGFSRVIAEFVVAAEGDGVSAVPEQTLLAVVEVELYVNGAGLQREREVTRRCRAVVVCPGVVP